MTVLVTTSLMCRTLVRVGFCFFCSAKRALRAASQSKTEWTERALKGERAVEALSGESMLDTAGLGGNLRLGKVAGPVGGADMGTEVGWKGLGGTMGAVAGGEALLAPVMLPDEVGGECSHLQEHSDCSLLAVPGAESSGVVSPEARPLPVGGGELRAMALERKSV